jgi:HEAT repeat protein
VRQAAADALALCGDDAVTTLATVLAGEEQGARTRAAYALRKIASLAAAAILFRCLNDANYMVHTYAYEGLDELGLLDNLLLIP